MRDDTAGTDTARLHAAIDRRPHRRRPYVAVAGVVVAAAATAIAVVSRPPQMLPRVVLPLPTTRAPIARWEPLLVDAQQRRDKPKVEAIAYDGEHLLYLVGDEYWVRTRGSVEARRHRQPPDVEMHDFALSVDGAKVFFRTVDLATRSHCDVREVDVQTETTRVLERDTQGYARPIPSPDGTQLMLVHPLEAHPHIAVIDLATGQKRLVVPGAVGNAAWSPDSRQIAFEVRAAKPRVDVIDLIDGRRTTLAKTARLSSGIAWPLPETLVFVENTEDPSGLELGRVYHWELGGKRDGYERAEQVYATSPGTTIAAVTTVRRGVAWQTQRSDLHLYELPLAAGATPHQLQTGLARENRLAGWRRNGSLVIDSPPRRSAESICTTSRCNAR